MYLVPLLLLGAVWGAVFLFMRVSAPQIGPVWAAEIRLAIGGIALAAVAGTRTLAAARDRRVEFVVVGALFAAVPFTLISFATVTLPAGLTALLNAATPLFTALVGAAFLGQRLVPSVVAGLGVGILAVGALVGWSPLEPTPTVVLAVAAGLGAPASYALAGNFVRARMSDVAPLELATGMLVTGALLALPLAVLSGAPRMPGPDGFVSLALAGTVSTALAWPIFFRVLRGTTPTTASSVTLIVPAFALAWASLVLREPVDAGLIGGFALILVSLVLVLGMRPPVPSPALGRARDALGSALRVPVPS